MTIYINIVYRAQFVTGDDRERARTAALRVLEDAGYKPSEAYSVYQAELAWLGTEEASALGRWQGHHHLKDPRSRAWVLAHEAADEVLMDLWHNNDCPYCVISA